METNDGHTPGRVGHKKVDDGHIRVANVGCSLLEEAH